MHGSIGDYLPSLASVGRSSLMVKAARSGLTGFMAWRETRRQCPLDPALLLDGDLREWRTKRQRDDAAAPATINRALLILCAYCGWVRQNGLTTEIPAEQVVTTAPGNGRTAFHNWENLSPKICPRLV